MVKMGQWQLIEATSSSSTSIVSLGLLTILKYCIWEKFLELAYNLLPWSKAFTTKLEKHTLRPIKCLAPNSHGTNAHFIFRFPSCP